MMSRFFLSFIIWTWRQIF